MLLTRISDFYKLVVTVLKVFLKKKPKIIQYRTFNKQLLRIELEKELPKIDLNNAELAEFYHQLLSALNKHAPTKYKFIRANNSRYMTKILKTRIHCEIFLSDYFIKHSLIYILIYLI